jgi:hypothetical protein
VIPKSEIPPALPIVHLGRTIDSFTDEECYNNLRFRKEHLHRLLRCFRLENKEIKLSNRTIIGGEEIMLFSLHRLASTAKMYEHCLTFGREQSTWSRVFHWFIDYVVNNFSHLLVNNLQYWEPKFHVFADKIRLKMNEKTGIEFQEGLFYVFGFHDDTVIGCCRPGGGPAEDGVGALRHSNFIQMAFYSGWKHHHGTKWQSLELPNGLCADMYGPFSFRHNDLEVFSLSNINERIADVQLGNEVQYLSYGDGIFTCLSHCKSKHSGNNLTRRQIDENNAMTSVRIANEWNYGLTAILWPRVKHKSSIKIKQHKNVSMIYFVATLLRNCRVCCAGNKVKYNYE